MCRALGDVVSKPVAPVDRCPRCRAVLLNKVADARCPFCFLVPDTEKTMAAAGCFEKRPDQKRGMP
jgi:hypothetical protein